MLVASPQRQRQRLRLMRLMLLVLILMLMLMPGPRFIPGLGYVHASESVPAPASSVFSATPSAMRTLTVSHGTLPLVPTSMLDYDGQPEPTFVPADSDGPDPLVALMPDFIWSMPVQVLIGGICLALAFVLGVHLAFTGRYHYPLSKTNFIMQSLTGLCLLINISSDLGITLSAVAGRASTYPYMLPYVNMEIPPPTGDWSSAQVGCYTILQAIVALAIHTTHIQFLTLLYPSNLERRLILWMLGPLAVCSAALLFSDLAPDNDEKAIDLSDAFRNICNSTLYLLYLCALLIWGLFINRRRAWRTDGGTAIFGMGASGLAFVTSLLSFLSIKWDRLWWLPQIGWTLTVWQSWLGFWWWVGAGMGIGEVEDREMRSAKRAARKAQTQRAAAHEDSVDDSGALSVEHSHRRSALRTSHNHHHDHDDGDHDGDTSMSPTPSNSRRSYRSHRSSPRHSDSAHVSLRPSHDSIALPRATTSSASLARSTRASIRSRTPHVLQPSWPSDLSRMPHPDQGLPASDDTLHAHPHLGMTSPTHVTHVETTPRSSYHEQEGMAQREESRRSLDHPSFPAPLSSTQVHDLSTREAPHQESTSSLPLPATTSRSTSATAALMQAARSATSALPRPAFFTERFRRLRVAHFAAARSAATQQTALRDKVLQKRQQRHAHPSHTAEPLEELDELEDAEPPSPLADVSLDPVSETAAPDSQPAHRSRSCSHSRSFAPRPSSRARPHPSSSGRHENHHDHRGHRHHHRHHHHHHRRRQAVRNRHRGFPEREEDYTLPPATPPPAGPPNRSQPFPTSTSREALPLSPRWRPHASGSLHSDDDEWLNAQLEMLVQDEGHQTVQAACRLRAERPERNATMTRQGSRTGSTTVAVPDEQVERDSATTDGAQPLSHPQVTPPDEPAPESVASPSPGPDPQYTSPPSGPTNESGQAPTPTPVHSSLPCPDPEPDFPATSTPIPAPEMAALSTARPPLPVRRAQSQVQPGSNLLPRTLSLDTQLPTAASQQGQQTDSPGPPPRGGVGNPNNSPGSQHRRTNQDLVVRRPDSPDPERTDGPVVRTGSGWAWRGGLRRARLRDRTTYSDSEDA